MKMLTLLLIVMPGLVASKDYDYGYDYEYLEYDDPPIPSFTDKPQTFTVKMGENVTLPCNYEPKDSPYVMLLKHRSLNIEDSREKLLYVGPLKITRSDTINRKGNNYILKNISPRQNGQYTCHIQALNLKPVVLNHYIILLRPAKVITLSDEHQLVEEGSLASFSCGADGERPPSITWSKQNGFFDSHDIVNEERYSTLNLWNVTRHDEGSYVCTAFNGIGEPSSAVMSLAVQYKPQIQCENPHVWVALNYTEKTKLVCIIYGRPTPTVFWMKDGHILESHGKYLYEYNGDSRYSLTITRIQEEDFGEYSCTATNTFGNTSHTITVIEAVSGVHGYEMLIFVSVVLLVAVGAWSL